MIGSDAERCKGAQPARKGPPASASQPDLYNESMRRTARTWRVGDERRPSKLLAMVASPALTCPGTGAGTRDRCWNEPSQMARDRDRKGGCNAHRAADPNNKVVHRRLPGKQPLRKCRYTSQRPRQPIPPPRVPSDVPAAPAVRTRYCKGCVEERWSSIWACAADSASMAARRLRTAA